MSLRRQKFDATINYYEVLDVPYSASRDQITRAYRNLMRHAHPDRHAGEIERARAEERARLLNAAYDVLGKPEVRREYDQAIKQQAVSDAIFQRYTGNVPGHHTYAHRPPRRPPSPELLRDQRRAHRSAFMQLMMFTVIFVVLVILIVVTGSLLAQGIGALL